LHLSLTFFNIDFYKEAFYNFYWCFENIVTNKVLQVEKLDKEVKDIEKEINKVGLKNIFTKQFIKSSYLIRSNQVMHAQKKQVNITLDDVYAIKTCLSDFSRSLKDHFYGSTIIFHQDILKDV